MPESKQSRVIVAMSGGVDSSVAAALLKKAGFEVVGVFMKFWHETQIDTDDKTDKHGKHRLENRCCSVEAQEDARRVAAKLGIPLYTLNLEKEFKKAVVDYFLKEYKAGRTPNPCVVCNKEIKFGLLLKKALGMRADFIATGHYARVASSTNGEFFTNKRINESESRNLQIRKFVNSKLIRYSLMVAKDKQKDQSYFLWTLTQGQLKRILFPIGDYTKNEVRKMAKKWSLPVAEKPESQEICFIPDGDLNRFLKCHIKTKNGSTSSPRRGPIVTIDGNLIGEHQGLAFYTIGQRKGIKISGKEPYFVVDKDLDTNTLIVAPLSQKGALLRKELVAESVNWISGQEPKLPLKVMAKIRYRQKPALALLTQIHPVRNKISNGVHTNKNTNLHKFIEVKFDWPQRAITPGQSVVFYKGSELLGGGIIRTVDV